MDNLKERHIPRFIDDIIIAKPYSASVNIEYQTGLMPPRTHQMSFAKTPEGIALMASYLLALHAQSVDDSVSDKPIVHSIRVM